MKGFQKLTTVDEALVKFLSAIQSKELKTESVPLLSALNRVLADNIIAKEDLPRFDRSVVDGYAVKAEDTFEASQFKPKKLRIVNRSEIDNREAKQVWTGNPLPKGANAVLMLENAKLIKDDMEVSAQLTPGENVSKKGEDVPKGETAVKAGIRLKPHHLGLIAALGVVRIKVFEKPRIAILATGNELVELGEQPRMGQIFNSNTITFSALCSELGAEPLNMGIAQDDVDEIMRKLQAGLEKADLVITTGGTSVGAVDLVPEAANRIGKPGVIVHGVAMRPAMPTAIATIDGKPILILSGNPVAAMMAFEVFARPVVAKMLGLRHEEQRPMVNARITARVTTALGRRTFVRVRVFQREGEFHAEPVSARGSGVISTMTKANGYVVVPENREGLGEGETVLVHLFDSIESER